MRRARRSVLRTRVPVVVAALLAACTMPVVEPAVEGVGSPDGSPGASLDRSASTVRVGLGRDPVSIDPRTVVDDEGELIVRALFDGLVDIAPDGSVAPAAASWTVEPDGLLYRFRLRDDRFHDGSPVTAQEHADALLATFDPDTEPRFRRDLLGALRGATVVEEGVPRLGLPEDVIAAGGVEVIAEQELVLRLERPDPLLLHRLADPVLVPLPSIAHSEPDAFAREPVGNGPFRMLGPREPGAFIRLRAEPDHPRPPRVDEIVFQIYADDADRSQRWADLLAGRLQITSIPVDRRDEARERFGSPRTGGSGPGLHETTTIASYAYGFALDAPPFDDVELRRAISAAIDREALARDLASAGVEAATAILPDAAGGSTAECAHCRHDPDLARDLVQSWRSRLPEGSIEPIVTLNYPRGGGHVTVAERIAADLEETLGLVVRLQSRDFGSLVRAIQEGEARLFRYGLRPSVGGRASAASLLDAAFRSDSPENWTRWQDASTDELLGSWTTASTPTVVRQVEARVLEDAAVIPLLWTRLDLVVHPDVAIFRVDATGRWWPELIRLR